jgi:hypothetical protein
MSRLRHSKKPAASKERGTNFVSDDGMKYGTKLQDGNLMANGGAAKLGRKRGGRVKRDDGGNISEVGKSTPSDNSFHSDAESYLKGRGKTIPLGPNWGEGMPHKFAPKPVDWQHTLPTKRTWYGAPTGEKSEDRLSEAKGGKVTKADGGKIEWIKRAVSKPGAETASAKKAGLSTHAYMEKHKHDSGKAGKRARLGLTLSNMSKHKS